MAQAFAFYDFDETQGRLVYTPGQVQPKYFNNEDTFPQGFVTPNDTWQNYWRAGQNTLLGCDAASPGQRRRRQVARPRSSRTAKRSRTARSRRCSGKCACAAPSDDGDRTRDRRASRACFSGNGYQLEASVRRNRRVLHGRSEGVKRHDARHQSNSAVRLRSRSSALSSLALAGCGGGGRHREESGDLRPERSDTTYNGPPPQTTTMQAFQHEFWDNVCATKTLRRRATWQGGQSPMFARNDDINAAYAAANPLVNRDNPALSHVRDEGRRRPQLLASRQRRVRRPYRPAGSPTGPASRASPAAQIRARAAATPRIRARPAVFPTDPTSLRTARVADAHGVLLGLPQLGVRYRAAAVLRRRAT